MKSFLYRLLLAITVSTAIAYFLSCLTPYISPEYFPPIAFLALGYPYLAIAIIALGFSWLFSKPKYSVFLFLLLMIGVKNLTVVYGFNINLKSHKARTGNSLRIMTWNVMGFDNPSTYSDTPGSARITMINYVRDSAPDVICLQEFAEHYGKGMVSNTTELIDFGYKYYFRTDEMEGLNRWGKIYNGTAIFSRIPIIESGKFIYNDSSAPEHLAYADVMMADKRLRIFSTHFKSLNLHLEILTPEKKVALNGDTNFIYLANPITKIAVFSKEHAIEAGIAKSYLNKSPYPFVFTADMNSVPSSYPYHKMSTGLQDAFLQKGFGLGTTMDSLPCTLRIDYLLVDKKIDIINYQLDPIHASDHYPQFIDIQWKQ